MIPIPDVPDAPDAPARRRAALRWWLALIALVLVAALLRLWRLGEIPFGFHSDEGHNALDALAILGGGRPIFLPGNNGREPLFHYLVALCLSIGGPTIRSARLAAALGGIAFLPLQALFVARLPLPRARRLALLSCALYAVTLWPVHQARYALRASLLPLWVVLMLWAWWHVVSPAPSPRTWRTWTWGWAALAGLAIGAAVHTHLTGRLLLAAPAASALWLAWRGRSARPLAAWALTAGVALAVAWPQVVYFRSNPEMLTYRAAQVSIFNDAVSEGRPARMLADNTLRLLAAPVWQGDDQWYHNVARRPVFPGAMAWMFGLGLLVLLRRLLGAKDRGRHHLAVLLGATAVVTTVPSLLSGAAPNFIRLTGAWPWLLLLPALGLDAVAEWLAKRVGGRAGRALAAASVGLLVGIFALATVRDYFGDFAEREEVYRVFNALAVERGYQIAELAREGPTVVSPLLWSQSVIRFTNAAAPPDVADSGAGLLLPAGATSGPTTDARDIDGASEPVGPVRYLFDPLEPDAVAAFARRWPAAERESLSNGADQLSLTLFRLSPAGLPAATKVLSATFGDQIALEGVRWDPAAWRAPSDDDRSALTLLVHALGPTQLDHNFFVRLLDEEGAELAGWDGPPLGGSHPTDRWLAGQRMRLDVPLSPPGDSREPASLLIGLYDWRDGRRLSLPGVADGALLVPLSRPTGPSSLRLRIPWADAARCADARACLACVRGC